MHFALRNDVTITHGRRVPDINCIQLTSTGDVWVTGLHAATLNIYNALAKYTMRLVERFQIFERDFMFSKL